MPANFSGGWGVSKNKSRLTCLRERECVSVCVRAGILMCVYFFSGEWDCMCECVYVDACIWLCVCVCVCVVSASVCGYVCGSLVCKCVFHRYYGRPACWQMHEKVFSRFPMLAMFSHVHVYGFITLLRPRVRIRA